MRRDELLLQEILDAARRIVELTIGKTSAEIDADRDRKDALMWNFTVLGEAASQLNDEIKAAYPNIEWSDPIRLRNRIVHGYWSADTDVLLATARHDVPALIVQLTGTS